MPKISKNMTSSQQKKVHTQLIKPTAAERDRQNADKTNRFVMRTKQ